MTGGRTLKALQADELRKGAEEVLHASELRYRRLFESAKDGILILNAETGTIVDVNPFLVKLLGFSREAFLTKKIWQLGLFKDIVANQASFAELQQKEYVRYEDKPLETADGRQIEVEFISNVYLANRQKVIQCNIRDITTRKKAQALRESEARLEGIADSFPGVLYQFYARPSGEMGLYFISQRVEEVFGLSRTLPLDEVFPRFTACMPPEERAAFLASIRRAVERFSPWEYEGRFIRPDGKELFFHGISQPVRAGDEVVFSGVMLDITEGKRAEEASRKSEEKYRCLFESSRDAIMTIEPPSWKFTSGNPATVKMFGAKNEAEFISHVPWELSPERQPDGRASAEKSKEMIETAVREGSHFFEWTHRRIGGEEFPADVLLTRMEQWGKVIVQATVRDITERKKLEEVSRQAQKMEAIGQLAGGVAHDFNNILTVICGRAELTLQRLKSGSRVRGDVEQILRAGRRAAALTQQLLAFSRQQPTVPKILSLNNVIRNLTKMLRRLLREDITLSSTLDEALWAVNADPSQLDQVLLNLAVNARDAMPGGGTLTVETLNAAVDEEFCRTRQGLIPGKYAVLRVSDTGCGMSKEVKARIFEPFFTTKGLGKGTGLGLATVYGVVKQNGGYIEVESEPAKGAAFRVYLPALEAKAPTGGTSTTLPAVKLGHETILVVEDEDEVRGFIVDVLEGYGYKAVTARDGVRALEIIKASTEQIHLLLTDVVMPEMGGLELAERAAALKPSMKVLAVSGHFDRAGIAKELSRRGILLVAKPVTPGLLGLKVREVLDAPGSRRLS
ncbi:MAG: PAS domain S-box protein [Planctomycetota bacterium]